MSPPTFFLVSSRTFFFLARHSGTEDQIRLIDMSEPLGQQPQALVKAFPRHVTYLHEPARVGEVGTGVQNPVVIEQDGIAGPQPETDLVGGRHHYAAKKAVCGIIGFHHLHGIQRLVLHLANRQLTLTGWVSGGVTLVAEAVAFFALAWIIWLASMAVAEAVIASPKIADQSLNAHLLRLVASTVGIAGVIVIIFYVSEAIRQPAPCRLAIRPRASLVANSLS